MTPKTYAILDRAVEEGVAYGVRRSFKHGVPTEDHIRAIVAEAVMAAIAEVFDFEEIL